MAAQLAGPLFAFQILTVLSEDPETINWPSGEYATEFMELVCPSNGCPTGWPLFAFQILTVLSEDPETINLAIW